MSSSGVLHSVLAIVLYCAATEAVLPSYCHNEHLIHRKGVITTDGIVRPAIYCHKWIILAELLHTVTISFSKINLGLQPDGTCGGNYLLIGKHRVDLCGKTAPFVYSEPPPGIKQNIEITYAQNSSRADIGFTAEYISVFKSYLTQCKPDEWQCSNKYCIWPSWVCNGISECEDGSDEVQCKTTTPEPLKCPHQLKCSSVTGDISCVNNSMQCKGEIVCDDSAILCQPYWLPMYHVCLNTSFICDGKPHCLGYEDEDPKLCGYTTTPSQLTCTDDQILCRSVMDYSLRCLDESMKCDGRQDCLNGEDESFCDDMQSCDKYIELTNSNPYGYITSPRFPQPYPDGIQCTWHFHSLTNDKIQLRFKSFKLENKAETDYVSVFGGTNTYTKHIGTYNEQNRPPLVIESPSCDLTVVFHSDSFITEKGFNVTYQNKGSCYTGQKPCGIEYDCYDHAYSCNGIWDCPLTGQDEKNCYMCRPNHYTCGPRINQCYEIKQRCDGIPNCTNMMDELYCTSQQCGHHNGTFLCGNGKCIYEMWKCDRYDHCGDNSDEEDCSHVTNEIKIAAVCGALICGLLLVVAFGCTCKLYNLRVHGHQHGRHEMPLSRLYSEFMRRRAPPPYHEAMLTSRPYDEVRRDYLEHLQQVNARPPSRRGRRNRNRNSDVPAATDGNSQENSNGNQNGLQEETQNSVNAGLERQNSTSLLLPESSASSDFDTDTENQTESVQVSISEENVVTAAYSRSGSQSNKSDSEEETNISPPNQIHPELDSVDICSVDATIASCDSMEDSDKPIEAVVVETITPSRHGSEESLDSIESEDHSFGEFTIAEC